MKKLEEVFGEREPVALVTGSGADRVGNVVARTLADRGYRLAIHANRSAANAERTAESIRTTRDAIAVVADLADEAAVTTAIEQVHSHFGRIDALVNCAAIWAPKSLENVTADDVRRNLEINTLGTFLCCQKVGLLMVDQPSGGAIVNMGDWAIARPYLNYAAYFPSKGAIPAMTRDLAVELASRNTRVRVNAILPGPVMLPDSLTDEEKRDVINATLVKREGSPHDVAAAAVFLLENDFVTGVCLPVDGGRTVYSP